MLGATARTAVSPIPIRSATPGRKFCTNTSAPATSRIRAVRPAGVLRSSKMERLFRLLFRKEADQSASLVCSSAGVIAAIRGLNLDNVCPLVSQDHGGERPGDHGGEINNVVAVQRTWHGTSFWVNRAGQSFLRAGPNRCVGPACRYFTGGHKSF